MGPRGTWHGAVLDRKTPVAKTLQTNQSSPGPLLQRLSLTTKVGLLLPLWDTSQDISLILGFMTNPLEVCSLPVSQPDYELQKGRKFVNPVTTRIPVLSPMPNIC